MRGTASLDIGKVYAEKAVLTGAIRWKERDDVKLIGKSR